MSEFIRNFVITAHIDHGKSTLADRFLEFTGTVPKHVMKEQFLDAMPLERERGITIKMQPVRMEYHPQMQNEKFKYQNDNAKSKNNSPEASTKTFPFDFYIFNLIDTPGHVDFSYEVSRALAAVEGAILLVDGTQGVQAQTLSHLEVARSQGLVIIPAINKVDLATCRVDETRKELVDLLGVKDEEIILVSGKSGLGVQELLEAVVRRVPSPAGKDSEARALIFDSAFDAYKGVIAYVRVVDGEFYTGSKSKLLATKKQFEILEAGYFKPHLFKSGSIKRGEIGYIATGLKEPDLVRVGDTIIQNVDISKYRVDPLPGYREPQPMVYASLWPEDADDYERFRESLGKTKLTDASLTYEPESAESLGRGFRVGFLGMLHLEIITERLRREFDLSLVVTQPSVKYLVKDSKGVEQIIFRASALPDDWSKLEIHEPWVELQIISPTRFLGSISKLLEDLGGLWRDTKNIGTERIMVLFEAPLREIIVDFIDRLKSISEGYASMSYHFIDFRKSDLVRLDFLVAGEPERALFLVVPRLKAYSIGSAAVKKLKELIPKQLFMVSLQGAVGGKVIAREDIPALKKDVTGYLYGGDRTRKMKLWKKQKRGKSRMKESGRVAIPAEVYLKMLQR